MNLSTTLPRWSLFISQLMSLLQFDIKHSNSFGKSVKFSLRQFAKRSQPVVLRSTSFWCSNKSMRAGALGMVLPSMPSRCWKTVVAWTRVGPSVSAGVRRRAARRPVGAASGPELWTSGGVISTSRCHLSKDCTGSKSSKSSMSRCKSLPWPGTMSSHTSCRSWSCGRSFSESRRFRLWLSPASALVSSMARAILLLRRSTRWSP
mmetsp:Transcript_23825/g.71124  ORF Transcript_23825/g.71124 Transcript_23825/m.71124 type:complete len:205 (+) Transcript_23825:111-725(+)